MKHIYIASPYTGQEIEGVNRQIKIAHLLIDAGLVPVWPLCSHYVHEQYPKDYKVWMNIDFSLLARCDVFLRIQLPSKGADMEEQSAIYNNIPVYYSVDEVIDRYGNE